MGLCCGKMYRDYEPAVISCDRSHYNSISGDRQTYTSFAQYTYSNPPPYNPSYHSNDSIDESE